MSTLGWPFIFGLWLGAFAGAGFAALFFAYFPPPSKTWVARGPRNVLTIRRAPGPIDSAVNWMNEPKVLDLPMRTAIDPERLNRFYK